TFSSNITSILAFYSYTVLGFSLGSFSPSGGPPYFDNAQELVNAAQNSSDPGWKAVEGRSNRMFDDVDAAFKVIKGAGYDEALLYERKPITLTAVETLLGKANFKTVVGEHLIKPPGKPALAPESDKRESYNPQSAASDFAGVSESAE
ncbi:MAG: DUF4835 family protein, partial [Eubacteriales bacterium]